MESRGVELPCFDFLPEEMAGEMIKGATIVI
jgi:hypothetical protein